jgi:hypothetical protein
MFDAKRTSGVRGLLDVHRLARSPARCPVRVGLFRVLLGQQPSLNDLLRPSLAFVRPRRWFRLTPSAHLVLGISELINFSDTQPTCTPWQGFKCGVARRPHMVLGQDYFTPVYPDAIQAGALPALLHLLHVAGNENTDRYPLGWSR